MSAFISAKLSAATAALVQNMVAVLLATIEDFDLQAFIHSLLTSITLDNWIAATGSRSSFEQQRARRRVQYQRLGVLAGPAALTSCVCERFLELADQHEDMLKYFAYSVIGFSTGTAFLLACLMDWDMSW